MKRKIFTTALGTFSLLALLILAGCQSNNQAASTNAVPLSNNGQTTPLNSDISTSPSTVNIPTGVTLKNGTMMKIAQDGQMTALDKEMTMDDGTKVTLEGKVMMKDGTEIMMKEGDTLMVDGTLVKSSEKLDIQDPEPPQKK